MGEGSGLSRSPVSLLLNVERLGAGRLAGGVERDLLDPRLGLAQQFLAAALERLAALVDRDQFLERNLALFEPLDDRFELLDRAFEGQALDVGIGGCRPCMLPVGASESRRDCSQFDAARLTLHQRADVGGRGIGEPFEVVAAFEHRYHAAVARSRRRFP